MTSEFDAMVARKEMMYRDTAREAQEHRAQGHTMTVSTLEALVPNSDIVSLDCECGEKFGMPFIRRDLLQ